MGRWRAAWVILAGLVLPALSPLLASPRTAPVVLWAWERTEDFRFLRPGEAEVAYLARTIQLRGGGFRVRSRRNPVRIPEGIERIAVVRVEGPGLPRRRDQVAAAIGELWSLLEVRRIQVDFDAVVGQRSFYRDLLGRLRRGAPPGARIAITALGSWCLGDPWIRDLPVDEAVPMLFRMGREDGAVRAALARGGDFSVKAARSSVGLSLDEPFPRFPSGRRVYLFSARPWTRHDYLKALERLAL